MSEADYKRMFERQVKITVERVDELFEERAQHARLSYEFDILSEKLKLLTDKGGNCNWLYDWHDDKWDTACENSFVVIDATPSENGMRYCPYCGRVINELIEKREE